MWMFASNFLCSEALHGNEMQLAFIHCEKLTFQHISVLKKLTKNSSAWTNI